MTERRKGGKAAMVAVVVVVVVVGVRGEEQSWKSWCRCWSPDPGRSWSHEGRELQEGRVQCSANKVMGNGGRIKLSYM